MISLSNAKRVLVSAAAGLLGILVGCAAPPQATNLSDELPFEQAVAQATDGLAAQTQKLPAFLAKVESKVNKRSVVLDPMLDAVTGQQTAATVLLENRVSRTAHDQDRPVRDPAVPVGQPGARPVPADRNDDAGSRAAARTASARCRSTSRSPT